CLANPLSIDGSHSKPPSERLPDRRRVSQGGLPFEQVSALRFRASSKRECPSISQRCAPHPPRRLAPLACARQPLRALRSPLSVSDRALEAFHIGSRQRARSSLRVLPAALRYAPVRFVLSTNGFPGSFPSHVATGASS